MSPEAKNSRLVNIFISYSHRDKKYLDKLHTHLRALERQNLLISWYDRKIIAGKKWMNEIDEHLAIADMILLLVSPDFISSDYCYKREFEVALERQDATQAQIIPIIIRPVAWEDTPIGKLQALPTGGKPVTTWKNMDQAFLDIIEGIRLVLIKKLNTSSRAVAGQKSNWLIDVLKNQSPSLFDRYNELLKKVIDQRLQFDPLPKLDHTNIVLENLATLIPKEMPEPLSAFELFVLLCSALVHNCRNSYFAGHENHSNLTAIDIHQNFKTHFLKHQDALALNRSESNLFCEIYAAQGMPDISYLKNWNASLKGQGRVRVEFLAALLRLADILDLCVDRGAIIIPDDVRRKMGTYCRISDILIKNLPSWDLEIITFPESLEEEKELLQLQNNLQDDVDILSSIFRKYGLFYKRVGLQFNRTYDSPYYTKTKNPFIGLLAFGAHNARFFAGRDVETQQVIQMITGQSMVILIGESGVGKTSLIEAGVLPKLRKFGYNMVKFSFQDDPVKDIFEKMSYGEEAYESAISKSSLPFLLEFIEARLKKINKPILLIGDHLEQMFTIQKSDEIKQNFIRQISYILSNTEKITFLFSIREDYLPELHNLSQDIPEVYVRRNTIRLHKLDKNKGIDVIKKASELSLIELPNSLINTIADDLCYEGDGLIYPPFLQIVGSRLYKEIDKSYSRDTDSMDDSFENIYNNLGGVTSIVNEYLEGLLDRYNVHDKPILAKILKTMVTEHHTKKRVRLDELKNQIPEAGNLESLLHRLIKQRIVRKTLGDYELIHDFIASRIISIVTETTIISPPVRKAINFIEQHYADPNLTSVEIAKAAHVTPNHLAALFNRQIRRTINDKLNRVRIAKAKELLENSLDQIYAIAAAVGFKSMNSFSRTFNKLEGTSPTKYRKSVLQKNNVLINDLN